MPPPATGTHKKTSHYTGRNMLLVLWLPPTMSFEQVARLKNGERVIHDHGLSLHMKFSNTIRAFGLGLPYFTAKGDEAILSFYLCEQTEQMW